MTRTNFQPERVFPDSGRWIELEISQHQRLIQSLPNWLEILETTHDAKIFGGYLEKRSALFDGRHVTTKTIHLGLDFWMPAETPVISPIQGKVVLAEPDNHEKGGWGGRIDIQCANGKIHTFGHLKQPTLRTGEEIAVGELLGILGDRHENGGWKPHLHYQCATLKEYRRFNPPILMDAYNEPNPELHLQYLRP